jgi:hypothetical protein
VKKLLAFILAITYLSTSIGATVHFHYCMDRLVAWGFGGEKTSPKSCPYCGMPKTDADKHCGKQAKGCCKDEQRQLKIEKDQKAQDAGFNLMKPIFQITEHSPIEFSIVSFGSPTLEYPVSHAPPRAEDVSLFLRNCVFRI